MSKQEYVMLAHVFNPKKHRVAGWFMSEKLDGTRAIWDGGISRGMPVEEVPYANTIKDGRFREEQYATGLWSRSGKPIHAPDWWLNQLPFKTVLDGELWCDYGLFQELRTIISGLNPTDSWRTVKYMVFDIPGINFFLPRDIKIRNEYSFSVQNRALSWAEQNGIKKELAPSFFIRHQQLRAYRNNVVTPVQQTELLYHPQFALNQMSDFLGVVLGNGGEGVMLRWGASEWVTERSHHLLKHKPFSTEDGKVIGYVAGEEGKTGRLLGMIGALIIKLENGKVFKLSGLTDEQRRIDNKSVKEFAEWSPGEQLPEDYSHHIFPLGTIVEFKYRELSDDGIPKEARFMRIKE